MPNWNEAEFTQRAQEIARKHAVTKDSLNNLAEKVARDENLNPEEIRTLVRMSNVATFQELFKNKTDGDKMVEFDTGSPEEVIRRIVDGDSTVPESANIHNDKLAFELPDQMSSVRGGLKGLEFGEEKTAAAVEEPVKAGRKDMVVLNLRKMSSELEIEMHRLGQVWETKVASLTQSFRKLYGPDFNEFEKDAYAEHGDDAAAELMALRQDLRLPAQAMSAEKVAHLQTHHLASSSKELELLKEAVSARTDYVRTENGLKWVQEQLSKLD